MTPVELTQLIILVVYLLGLLLIGYLATRMDASMEEYFLADRGLGAWASAISSTASSESAWVTLGAVGMGYANGMSAAWFIPGCILGYCLNWYFIAPRLRRISKQRGTITIPDFLEDRVDDRYHLIRIVAVLIIFFAMAAYVGAQFKASGKLFSRLFFDGTSWGKHLGIIIGAAITIIYTMFGGFRASAWTDLVQGLIMVVGLTIFPVVLFFHLGGVGAFVNRLAQEEPREWIVYEVQYHSTPDQVSRSSTFRLDRSEGNQTVYVSRSDNIRIGRKRPEEDTLLYSFKVSAEASDEGNATYQLTELQGPSSTQISLPVTLKTGRSIAVDKHLLIKPKSIKSMNPGRDLIDPFGSTNNESKGGGKKKSNDDPLFPVSAPFGLVIGLMGIGLGYPGMPHVLSRYMATRDQQSISRARVIAILWGILAFYGAVVVGMQARILIPYTSITDQELAFPILATRFMPAVLSGILISAILAAIMSTADSMIIVASSAVSRDLCERVFLQPDADQTKLVWISRITVFVLGTLGVVAAILNVQLIFWFVLVAWAVLGASFGPAMILSVTWRGLTKWGVLSGLVVGSVSSVLFERYPSILKAVFGRSIYELVPAFILSFGCTVLVSLMTTPPEDVDDRM